MSVSGVRFAATLLRSDEQTQGAMERITELLAHDVDRPVEALYADSPEHLAELLATGEADFAWLSPTLLLMAPSLATMVPLLSSVRQGSARYHSVVFTSASSPIKSLGDLKNVRAAWVDATSASGYLVPQLTLERLGLRLDRAIREESFCRSHGAVAERVFYDDADIGATYAHFRDGDPEGDLLRAGFLDAMPSDEARILAVSGPIPADMIVAHSSVPIPLRIAFAAALCRLVHDPVGSEPINYIIGAEDFRPVAVDMLEELQSLMRAASKQ